MNEEEAVERCEKLLKIEHSNWIGISNQVAIEKILKLIDKQTKVIDEMSEVLNDFDYDKQCESCRTDICSASVDGTGYTKCIKQYFIRKVEKR